MPSNKLAQRQRALGGGLGVAVLALGLVYHFFPRTFHVDPASVTRHSAIPGATWPSAAPSNEATPQPMSASELNAGPPLTLAPTRVIANRLSRINAELPKQLTPDSAPIRALLSRADKALAEDRLIGNDSAAALYGLALAQKPDSRRAAQGLYDVHARLVVQIDESIATGDARSATDLLSQLKTLPHAESDVSTLSQRLATLDKIQPLLAHAATLQQQATTNGRAGDQALGIYRHILAVDPQNTVAEQGVLQAQRIQLDRALAAVAQNDFTGADKALSMAANIEPDSLALVSTREQIHAIRMQRTGNLLAQARSALDGGNQLLARQLADQVKALSPDAQGLNEFEQQLINARLYGGYKPAQIFTDRYLDLPGQGPAMVVVPIGSLQMGSPADEPGRTENEQPQHTVNLSHGFALSRSEITIGQFRAFVRASGYQPSSVKEGASIYDEDTGALREDSNATWEDDYKGRKADDDLPVVNLSWNDASAYAQWLSQHTGKHYRLPSEAEYEYALRGGTTSRYWWGDAAPNSKVENLAGSLDRSPNGRRWSNAFNGYRDGYWGPAPVMSFAANPFGLYDVDGNVSAWTEDCWHDSYLRAPTDGTAWVNPGCTVHTLRGGSWGSPPQQTRSAYRQAADGSTRSARVGLRIVREL